jgi:hypothetical protein
MYNYTAVADRVAEGAGRLAHETGEAPEVPARGHRSAPLSPYPSPQLAPHYSMAPVSTCSVQSNREKTVMHQEVSFY